jgi:hypothetical protein
MIHVEKLELLVEKQKSIDAEFINLCFVTATFCFTEIL